MASSRSGDDIADALPLSAESRRRVKARLEPWRRRLPLALAVGIAMGALAAPSGAPEFGRGRGPGLAAAYADWVGVAHRAGIDALLIARHIVFGPLFPASESDVAVVVIDEETYRTPPFRDTPKVAWTPMLAPLIEAIDGAGATVIGLDQIYPTSLDRGDLLPGFDRPLLKAFYKVGRAGRLVLGETRLSRQALSPYPGQVMAVGGNRNLASLNLILDRDEIVRRHPAWFREPDGSERASFAVELARRAGRTPPAGDFLINYNTGPNDIPTYSLADLHACGGAAAKAFLGRHFKDRIVLIGSVLDIEDRRLAANRFADAPDPSFRPSRCALPFDQTRFGEIVDRRSLPGVYIHAAAINTLTKDLGLAMPGAMGNFLLTTAVATVVSLIFFALPPLAGAIAGLAALGLEAAASLLAFRHGLVLPVLAMALSCFVAFAIVYAYRFTIEDKTKRRIQGAFRHYLAPTLVDRLAERADSLRLGGEVRRVTVWFSDIVGYTSIAERLNAEPEKLVEVVNRYFTALSAVVERHGGYIDKFIGDAVMCVWGAPLEDAEAERHALEAALDAVAALERFNREVVEAEYELPRIGTRIGINTGLAVVGNMGSTTRFNYTVTGDTVNLASRLEGANKSYGSLVMVGEKTARGLGRDFVLRRLDRLVVKGRSQPLKVYELVGRAGEVSEAHRARIKAFHGAMALYYRRRFEAAGAAFEALAKDDEAARLYAERCRHYLVEPPPDDWDRSFTMTTK